MTKRGPLRRAFILLLRFLRAVLIGIVVFCIWKYPTIKQYVWYLRHYHLAKSHIHDEAGLLTVEDADGLNDYLKAILIESDVDVSFFIVKNTGMSLEDLAVKKMAELGIGKTSREERGVLVLYDAQSRGLRIEIGYGLESYFPDAFLGYLVREHAKHYFEAGNIKQAVHLLLRILHGRIREAVLGDAFDPTVLDVIGERGHLSGGGGVSAAMPEKNSRGVAWNSSLPQEERDRYRPGKTPEETYGRFLSWSAEKDCDPEVPLFTLTSRGYLSTTPFSRAYREYMLLGEYGKKYEVLIRGDLAILYFTNTPFVSPHFFRRSAEGWRMDIFAEVEDTKELVGGYYTWTYSGNNDDFTKTFYDILVTVRKIVIRFQGGDNRELPIRGRL